MAFPAAQVVSLQGFTILIGAVSGPAAVAAFTTLRTLSRAGYQAVCALSRALWPELSRAFGAGDLLLARSLHRHAWRAGLGASVLMAIALRIFGPFIYTHWTRHAVAFNPGCFQVLLIVSVLGSLWYISSVAPMSANLHLPIALSCLLMTCLTLSAASVLTRWYGLNGAVTSLLLSDFAMCGIALRAALRQTHDTARDFFGSVFRIPLKPAGRTLAAECNA
jgi:O-antigen/teichoic acid export membrane protein